MEYVSAEIPVRSSIQASVDKLLSEKGLLDLFYSNYITDFYLVIDECSFYGVRLVLERMGNRISLIYDFISSGSDILALKQHRDVEMIFELPSWEPISLEHHHFSLGQQAHTLENRNLSNISYKRQIELTRFSRVWASNFRQWGWDQASDYQYGYKIDGKWHQARIRER